MLDGLLETFFRAGWKILGTNEQLLGSFRWRASSARFPRSSAGDAGFGDRCKGPLEARIHRIGPVAPAHSSAVSGVVLRLGVSLFRDFELNLGRRIGAASGRRPRFSATFPRVLALPTWTESPRKTSLSARARSRARPADRCVRPARLDRRVPGLLGRSGGGCEAIDR